QLRLKLVLAGLQANEPVLTARVADVGELAAKREIGRGDRRAGQDRFRFVGHRADDRGFDLGECGGGSSREEDERSEPAPASGLHDPSFNAVSCAGELDQRRGRARRPRTASRLIAAASASPRPSIRPCAEDERAPVARRRMSSYFALACSTRGRNRYFCRSHCGASTLTDSHASRSPIGSTGAVSTSCRIWCSVRTRSATAALFQNGCSSTTT